MTTKKANTKKPARGKDTKELDALAHHISETLRILRESDFFPARVYNGFLEAWNDLCNIALGEANLWDTEEYARLVLTELTKRGA